MGDDDACLICLRIAGTPTDVVARGSQPRVCSRCAAPVWASPASLAAAGGQAKIICVACAMETLGPDDRYQPPTHEQRAEIAENRLRRN